MENDTETEIVYKEEVHPIKDQGPMLLVITILYVIFALGGFLVALFSGSDDVLDPFTLVIFSVPFVIIIIFTFIISLFSLLLDKRRWEKYHCLLRSSGVEAYDFNLKSRREFPWSDVGKIALSNELSPAAPKWLRNSGIRAEYPGLQFFHDGETEPFALADWGLGPIFSKKAFKEDIHRFAPHIIFEGLDEPQQSDENNDDQAIQSYQSNPH